MRALSADTNGTVNPILFAGAGGSGWGGPGIFRSTDNGTSWTMVYDADWVFCFAMSGKTLYAGKGGRVLVSKDDGITWTPFVALPLAADVISLTTIDSTVFAGTTSGIFRSIGGNPWTRVDINTANSLFVSGVNIVSANYARGFIFSTDHGSTWEVRNTGLRCDNINSLCVSNSLLFAGSTEGGVFVSYDSAATWIPANSGLNNTDIRSITHKGTNLFAGTGGGVFLSTNHGSHWSEADSGMPNDGIRSITVTPTPETSSTVVVTTSSGVLYVSSNNGTSWTYPSSGIINYHLVLLAIGDSNLFVSGESGVWRYPLSQPLTSVEHSFGGHPIVFRLEQNYPNPFNPLTQISFSLSMKSFATLKVYDLVGREVAIVVSEELPSGNHTRQWNASHLSSGVYFYRLQAGTYSATKKLVLLK